MAATDSHGENVGWRRWGPASWVRRWPAIWSRPGCALRSGIGHPRRPRRCPVPERWCQRRRRRWSGVALRRVCEWMSPIRRRTLPRSGSPASEHPRQGHGRHHQEKAPQPPAPAPHRMRAWDPPAHRDVYRFSKLERAHRGLGGCEVSYPATCRSRVRHGQKLGVLPAPRTCRGRPRRLDEALGHVTTTTSFPVA